MRRNLAIAMLLFANVVITYCPVAVCARQDSTSSNWPAWRGPNADGVAADTAQPPIKWTSTENVSWKTPVPGKGLGTPIVWGDRLFLLTAIRQEGAAPAQSKENPPAQVGADGKQGGGRGGRGGPPPVEHDFVVLCLDANTGKILWQKSVIKVLPHESHHQTNSYASGSAVTNGEHVYASFGSFGVYCLTMDGEIVWSKDFGDMRTRNSFGEGSSPALHDSTLIVPWDHEGQSKIYALDSKSGEIKWQAERDEPTTWATPFITEFQGRHQVVTTGTNRVRSYDLESGKLIWECGGLGPNPIPTPIRIDDMVICMTGFRSYSILAIPLASKGDVTGSKSIVWQRNDAAPYVPSPLLYQGHLYITKSQEPLLSILDARTGKTLMEPQRLPDMSNLYASPLAADGRVYISSRNGTTVVLKHGTKFELLATNKLDETLDASPVAIGRKLYLRGDKHLYCLEQAN